MAKPFLSPIEYEILFALIQLKHKGCRTPTLKDVSNEVNHRRKQVGTQTLSIQHVYYYLKKLTRHPFVKKIARKSLARYMLEKGTWKLAQSPPLCIHINKSDIILICDKASNCKKTPSVECIINLGLLPADFPFKEFLISLKKGIST
ncbi:MAG: hypothetical protein NZ932_03980 [Candidatus Bathyarchaeota archaeon]|nr:hypothetical protein [Candidatus Bathyarchaeota archaeon]MDW8022372.1 hypothetical protein [Nitrososphaerota archaeon]